MLLPILLAVCFECIGFGCAPALTADAAPVPAEPAELFQHDGNLSGVDPEIADLIKQEKGRQVHGLELIASENFTSRAVSRRADATCCREYMTDFLQPLSI